MMLHFEIDHVSYLSHIEKHFGSRAFTTWFHFKTSILLALFSSPFSPPLFSSPFKLEGSALSVGNRFYPNSTVFSFVCNLIF